ncbi:MAG TPA: VOC family protein [Verrucomicrobiae bacterium]|nr:VOC family protein [Verrucomicrobiae bacterium]
MKAKPIPEDCHSITPYLLVPDVGRLIEFLKQAFGAVERAKIARPNGTILHAQVRIGDSILMIGEPQSPWKPQPSMLYLYVADVDATYKQAVAAGGVSVNEPVDMFYGDRSACVKDVAENAWWIATHKEELTTAEIQERATEFFKKMAAKPRQ